MINIQTIKEGLKKPGKSRKGLAHAMGVWPSAITSLLDGGRQIKAAEVTKIERYLELDASVPIVGVVRAGGEAFYPEAANLGRAVIVPGAGPNTVAVEIQGNSLGAEFEGWIAYYDNIHNPPSAHLLGQLCVIGLKDGRIVLKTLRSAKRGLFHLFSSNSEPITDVQVEWAALVIDMKPRHLAVLP